MMLLGIGLYESPGGALLYDLAARGQRARFSTNWHGFEAFGCFLPLPLSEAFRLYDRTGLPHVAVTLGGLVVWEGRLEDVEIVSGGVRLGALGYIRGYADAPYAASHTGVTAQTIVRALVTNVSTLHTRMSSSTVLVQDPGLFLAEVYEDRYPLEILDRLCSLGDTSAPPLLWEAAVWEGRVLAFQPRGDAGRQWYIDVAEPNVERTLETLWNSVYAVYQDGGNARTVTATSAEAGSVARYGLTRRQAVRLQTQDATLAAAVRDAYLEDHQRPPLRATLRLRELYDSNGLRYPCYLARSGDRVTIRNLPPTLSTDLDRIRKFRLKDTDYAVDADELTITPEALFPGLSPQDQAQRGRGFEVTSPDFKYQAQPTLAALYAEFQGLPGLRGLWYPNSVDNTGALYDQSGQGRTLTYNGNPTLGIHNSFIPYWDEDGTGDWHSRADEAGLDILGTETTIVAASRGLTMGGWFWFDVADANATLMGKSQATGNQRSYLMGLDASSFPIFGVSSLGTAFTLVTGGAAPATGAWQFWVGRFDPSDELALWVNGTKIVNTTSIPAAIFGSSAAFGVAGRDGGAFLLNGRHALTFVCAARLTDGQIEHLFNRTRTFFGV